MKRLAWLGTLLVLGTLAADGLAARKEKQTLTGEYYWVGDRSTGDLRAVFTATADREWNVAFYFTFNGRPHTYRGTASGSLSEGNLEGEVQNENRRRTFTFEGAFEDGVIEGTHAEIRRGRASQIGTLTLSR